MTCGLDNPGHGWASSIALGLKPAELFPSWGQGAERRAGRGQEQQTILRVSFQVTSSIQLVPAPNRLFSMKSLIKAILPGLSHLSATHNQVGPSVQHERLWKCLIQTTAVGYRRPLSEGEILKLQTEFLRTAMSLSLIEHS